MIKFSECGLAEITFYQEPVTKKINSRLNAFNWAGLINKNQRKQLQGIQQKENKECGYF